MMKKQNPGWRAGASRDQMVICPRFPSKQQQRQTQMLIARFGVSHSLACTLARLAYGEAANDK